MRGVALFCCVLSLSGFSASHAESDARSTPTENGKPDWSLSAWAYAYFPVDDDGYVQPTFQAERGWLHLQFRYNYEDLETGSVWIGYNFEFGEALSIGVTPMAGAVIGQTPGIAPGYMVWLEWWRLEFSSEAEYVFDLDEKASSFFYSWTQATISIVDWLQAGLVAQRTRMYHSEREIDRGVMIGATIRQFQTYFHVFNPDDERPTYVVSLAADF